MFQDNTSVQLITELLLKYSQNTQSSLTCLFYESSLLWLLTSTSTHKHPSRSQRWDLPLTLTNLRVTNSTYSGELTPSHTNLVACQILNLSPLISLLVTLAEIVPQHWSQLYAYQSLHDPRIDISHHTGNQLYVRNNWCQLIRL